MKYAIIEQLQKSYDISQWLFMFFTYSIMGWIWESIYMSCLERKPLNRGFLYGPCIPLYGAGATIVLFFTMPFKQHWWAVAIAGMISATILEEITGRVMESVFDIKYWTYEGYPGNIDDIICIPATVFWGVCSLMATYVFTRPFDYMFTILSPKAVYWSVFFCSVLFTVDVTLSVKDALDFKDIVVKFANGKEELQRLKKRLDVMIAFYDQNKQYSSRIARTQDDNQIDAFPNELDSVHSRIDVMNEIQKNSKEKGIVKETDLQELEDIKMRYYEQESMLKHYARRFFWYIRHLLFRSPKARILRLGISLRDAGAGFKNKIFKGEKE